MARGESCGSWLWQNFLSLSLSLYFFSFGVRDGFDGPHTLRPDPPAFPRTCGAGKGRGFQGARGSRGGDGRHAPQRPRGRCRRQRSGKPRCDEDLQRCPRVARPIGWRFVGWRWGGWFGGAAGAGDGPGAPGGVADPRRVRIIVLPVRLAYGTGRRARSRVVASARASIACSSRVGVQVSKTGRAWSARRGTGSSDASGHAHVARRCWVTVFVRLTSSAYCALSRADRAVRAVRAAHTRRRRVQVSIVRAVFTPSAAHRTRSCVRASITCRALRRCIAIQVSCATRAWIAACATHTSVVPCSAGGVFVVARSRRVQIVVVVASGAREALSGACR